MTYSENVIYVNPGEVMGWEHYDSYDSLVDIAKHNLWEDLNIPPCEVYSMPNSLSDTYSNVKYIVRDGHHRHNAAHKAGKPFPIIVRDDGKERRDNIARSVFRFHGKNPDDYDPDRNPYTSLTDEKQKWNADNAPTIHYVKETRETRDYWKNFYVIKDLRDSRALDEPLETLLYSTTEFSKEKDRNISDVEIEIGASHYDHHKSSVSTLIHRLTISYNGENQHPENITNLIEHGQLHYSSWGKEYSISLKEAADKPLSCILRFSDDRTIHELEIKTKVNFSPEAEE